MCAIWRSELLGTLSEDVLVERGLDGDTEALEEIFRRYSKPIYSFISNYVGDPEIAQDAFQEAFLRAFKNLKKYRLGTNFAAWLHKVALNVSKDCLKKKHRSERMEVWESETFDPLTTLKDGGLSPQEALERSELQGRVREALSDLSSTHRAVVILYQFQGFSYEEIAQMLGCPLGTVKSRLHYAMKKLADLLLPVSGEW